MWARRAPSRRLRCAVHSAALVGSISLGASALAACGSNAGSLSVQHTVLGSVLGDSQGRVVYAYTQDPPSATTCVDDCAHDWPPVMAAGKPVAGDGVSARLISTVRRPGGARQLAYRGHPLYRWAGDRSPGDVRGQAVGAIWFVVRPDGSLLRAPSPATGTFSGNAPTSLTLIRSPLGPIVADATGAPVYMFKDDGPNASACISLWCSTDWPPATAEGAPTGAPGITGKVGTLRRPDGLTQLSLAGHPLYNFAGDLHPGDLRGQALAGDWFVLDGAGQPIHLPAPAGR
jgi:predicted lipoprotein with Yx(FWY)xxD motif